MAQPAVSVIIPAFNAAASLENAVRSALGQDGVNLEIIIIDDASQDETLKIARSLAEEDGRIRVIARTANGGVSRARNDGISEARGIWVTPLDADDFFDPGRLAAMTEEAERTQADILADNVTHWHNGQSSLLFKKHPSRSAPLDIKTYIRSQDPRVNEPSLGYVKPLIRRYFLMENNIHYPDEIHCAEDWHLYLECLYKGARFFFLPTPYYNYTVHLQSTSRVRARRVINVLHLLKMFEAARQMALDHGDLATADYITEWLPHYRRRLLKERVKRAIRRIPMAGTAIDWVKKRKKARR